MQRLEETELRKTGRTVGVKGFTVIYFSIFRQAVPDEILEISKFSAPNIAFLAF